MRKDFFLIFSGILLIVFVYLSFQLFVPVRREPEKLEILIPKGMTFREAVNLLYEKRLIRDRNLFIILGRLTGLHRSLRYGYYEFLGGVSPASVFRKLLRGEIEEYEIKFIEGQTLAELAEVLEEKGIVDKDRFFNLVRDRSLLKELSVDAPSLEGYLYPTTYRIPKGTDVIDILKFMVNTMRKMINPYIEKAEEMGLSENELLTLASIIEKEARVDYERPLISAVYHNRLKRKMKLQADPTAVYELRGTKKLVTRKDLLRKSIYNTYMHKGLPPGPIAAPGLKSIVAAVNPAQVPYLYFVSNNDGTHYFSERFDEHRQAVQEYIKKKRLARQRSEDIRNQKRENENTYQSQRDTKPLLR
ncbi:MAG: endolytic transglycosylase MltG [Thermodesulfovibrionales bacterium]|nr:endolytic transglycosylase MltG [Thermodesulfovibrionales bacterium]